METWEYMVIRDKPSHADTMLNAFGQRGWELVCVHQNPDNGYEFYYYFKMKAAK